jgi:predicted NBD/HSP70 family sugar kinase
VRNRISPVTFTTQGALRKSALRQANDRLVLNVIRQNPTLSRIDIARHTGLSPSSITFIVKRLARHGLVREERVEPAPQSGRPPMQLRLTPSARFAIGVDISPTGPRIAVADWTGAMREVRPLPGASDAPRFLDLLRAELEQTARSLTPERLLGVGISVSGAWDSRTGVITEAPNLGWREVSMAPVFDAPIGAPVHIDNNANLSALGERWFRPPDHRPLDNFVFVTLGGGIGTGIVSGGQLLRGAQGRAGEFGHMTLEPDGRECLCGNFGCWEEYASDRALIRLYRENSRRREPLTAVEVVERARAGENAAIEALSAVGAALGIGFANLILGLNPQAVVLDSWGAIGWDLVKDPIRRVLRRRLPPSWQEGVRIMASARPLDASLYGALALALSSYFHSFEHQAEDEAPNEVRMQT